MHCDLQHDQQIRDFASPFRAFDSQVQTAHSFRSVFFRLPIVCLFAFLFVTNGLAEDSFDQSIRPLLRDFCVTCHSTEKQEGEFDLERFDSLDHVQLDADAWDAAEGCKTTVSRSEIAAR
jgi:hypothetical protein